MIFSPKRPCLGLKLLPNPSRYSLPGNFQVASEPVLFSERRGVERRGGEGRGGSLQHLCRGHRRRETGQAASAAVTRQLNLGSCRSINVISGPRGTSDFSPTTRHTAWERKGPANTPAISFPDTSGWHGQDRGTSACLMENKGYFSLVTHGSSPPSGLGEKAAARTAWSVLNTQGVTGVSCPLPSPPPFAPTPKIKGEEVCA